MFDFGQKTGDTSGIAGRPRTLAGLILVYRVAEHCSQTNINVLNRTDPPRSYGAVKAGLHVRKRAPLPGALCLCVSGSGEQGRIGHLAYRAYARWAVQYWGHLGPSGP